MRKLPSSLAENRPSWSMVPPVDDQVTIRSPKGLPCWSWPAAENLNESPGLVVALGGLISIRVRRWGSLCAVASLARSKTKSSEISMSLSSTPVLGSKRNGS